MTSSSLVTTIHDRLREAGYEDLPTPFRIAGVEFQFTGAMRGRHGRALDLVLLVDTTAGSYGDSDSARVRSRVQALSRALDVTGSRYVVTTVLAGAALGADMETLAETCRVLHVEAGPPAQTGEAVPAWLEDRIRVLLPLSIPQATTDTETGTAQEQLEEALAGHVDATTIENILAASPNGETAVTSTIAAMLDGALDGELDEKEDGE